MFKSQSRSRPVRIFLHMCESRHQSTDEIIKRKKLAMTQIFISRRHRDRFTSRIGLITLTDAATFFYDIPARCMESQPAKVIGIINLSYTLFHLHYLYGIKCLRLCSTFDFLFLCMDAHFSVSRPCTSMCSSRWRIGKGRQEFKEQAEIIRSWWWQRYASEWIYPPETLYSGEEWLAVK